MNSGIRVIVLADNTVTSSGLLGEHGLAFWIATGDRHLLFDAGQGTALAANARNLGVRLDLLDTVVLSHGHYDHTGGLASVLGQAARVVTVHAHPDSLLPKYVKDADNVRDIGILKRCREAIVGGNCRFISSRQPKEVAPGIWTTGEIPRNHPEEAITEPFCCDTEGREPDPLLDDQALFVRTPSGVVVLLGCAHAGIVNTLDAVQRLTDNAPIRAVIGGMHLRDAGTERLEWTISALRRLNIGILAPAHCTGLGATVALWTAFPSACRKCGVGTTFDL